MVAASSSAFPAASRAGCFLAGVRRSQRAQGERIGLERLLTGLLGAESALVGMRRGFEEPTTQALRLGEQHSDVRDRALVTDRSGEVEHALEGRLRGVELLPPHAHDRDLELGAAHRPGSASRRPQRICLVEGRPSLLETERGLGEEERAEPGAEELRDIESTADGDGRTRMLDRLDEPLAEAEEDPRQDLVGLGLHEWLCLGLGHRILEQLDSRADVVVQGANAREHDQRACALDAWREPWHDVVQQRPRPAGIAGVEVVARSLDRTPPGRVGIVHGRQCESLLEQLGRSHRRSARRGKARRLVKRCGDLAVRAGGAEREVSRPLLRIAHERGESHVEVPPVTWFDTAVRGRAEQRVREPDPARADRDDLLLDRDAEDAAGIEPRCGTDELERRIGECCRCRECPPRVGGQSGDPGADQLPQRGRHRSSVDQAPTAPLNRHARELQREERIPVRRRVHRAHDGPR